jgi:hypothetical protein
VALGCGFNRVNAAPPSLAGLFSLVISCQIFGGSAIRRLNQGRPSCKYFAAVTSIGNTILFYDLPHATAKNLIGTKMKHE